MRGENVGHRGCFGEFGSQERVRCGTLQRLGQHPLGRGPQLDSTGTWTLVVDPYQDAVGAQKFTLSLVPDVTRRLTLGKRLTVAIGQRGADGRYTFTWNGQGTLMWAADLGLAGDISLIDPGGNRVAGARVQDGSTAGTFTGNGASGTWTLLYDPGSATGTGHITLSKAG